MIAGAFVLYSIYYFTIVPPYKCNIDGKWSTCTTKDFCDGKGNHKSGVKFQVDYDNKDEKVVAGWILQYNLYCATEFEISLIGSCFFAGCFIGSFVLPRLADVVGRKPMFLLGLFLYTCTITGLLFASSQTMLYALLVLGGISETGRYYVAYVYAIEIMPKRLQSFMGLIIFMMFAWFKIFVCIYFWQVASPTWKTMGYVAIGFAVTSFVLTLFTLPESPRFLASKGQNDTVISILQVVQETNGGANKDLKMTPDMLIEAKVESSDQDDY